jgi:hypothetical protein
MDGWPSCDGGAAPRSLSIWVRVLPLRRFSEMRIILLEYKNKKNSILTRGEMPSPSRPSGRENISSEGPSSNRGGRHPSRIQPLYLINKILFEIYPWRRRPPRWPRPPVVEVTGRRPRRRRSPPRSIREARWMWVSICRSVALNLGAAKGEARSDTSPPPYACEGRAHPRQTLPSDRRVGGYGQGEG